MENQNKKLDHLLAAGDRVQGALDIIEELQKLSYSRAAGEDGFTLADSRCLLDKAAVYLYDARSAISRQMAQDNGEARNDVGEKHLLNCEEEGRPGMKDDLTDREHQVLLRHVAGLNWIRNMKDKDEFFCPNCYWDQAFGEGTPQSNGYFYCPHCGVRLIGWVYLNPYDPKEAAAAEILKANLEAVKC